MELTRRRLFGLGAGMSTGLLLAACGGGRRGNFYPTAIAHGPDVGEHPSPGQR